MKPSELPDLPAWVPVALDSETSGLHPDDRVQPETATSGKVGVSVVSVAWELDGEVTSLAWPFDQGLRDKLDQGQMEFELDPNLDEAEWRALLHWLDGRKLVFHNAPFDLAQLRAGTRHWDGLDLYQSYHWDTFLAAHILWPRDRLGLGAIAARQGIGEDKAELQDAVTGWVKSAKLGKGIGTKDNPRFDLAPWSVMEPYAAGDTELTIKLYHLQQEALDLGEAMRSRVEREIAFSRVLYLMEQRGLGFDAQGCLREAARLAARVDKLKAQLPFTPTLPGAKRYFFEELGIPPVKTTEKGAPQLDDEVRRVLHQRGTKWVAEYDQLVRLEKAESMWYRGWPAKVGDDGRLRCVYRQAHVRSGRVSVNRTQLQAIPKDDKAIEGLADVRSFFVPREGYSLWNLDLSQAELRYASYRANCLRMLAMLADGADLHGITTTELFGIRKGHPDWKSKRDIAKRLTFGGIFQIGAQTFQDTLSKLAGIEMPLPEVKQIVYSWRDLYPEFGRAYRHYDNIVQDRGYVEVVGHERSYFGERDWSNTGWSRVVQGSLAKYLRIWLPEVEKQAPGALVLTVHDSAVLELPLVSKLELVPGGEDGELVHPVALAVAQAGSELATRVLRTPMRVDVGSWNKNQKHHRDQGAK